MALVRRPSFGQSIDKPRRAPPAADAETPHDEEQAPPVAPPEASPGPAAEPPAESPAPGAASRAPSPETQTPPAGTAAPPAEPEAPSHEPPPPREAPPLERAPSPQRPAAPRAAATAQPARPHSEAAARPSGASGPSQAGWGSASSPSAGLRQRLHKALIVEIDQGALTAMPEGEARSFVEQAVRQLIDREIPAGRPGFRERLEQQLVDDVLGLGPLEPLLRDKSISEIMVNGPEQVYVERAGKLTLADVRFQDDAHVTHVIERILAPTGRTIDESNPMVDARLPDGSRVNAAIPPASITGPLLTIRKFVADRLTAEDLVASGSLTQDAAGLLNACVHAGLNIIVSGGTGSGKTTLLNVLSSWIPADQRIITIEDPAELSLRQPHVVALEARAAQGSSTVLSQAALLRNALRMRPDRIVVGETRGAEAFDMLQAMNTGHEGSLSTVHANSPRDAIRRIENMVMMAGYDLPVKAIREQIASAINLVIQIARLRDGTRRVVAISEIVGMEDQTVTMQDLFVFEHRGEDESGRLLGVLKPTGLRPTFSERLEERGVHVLIPAPTDLEDDDDADGVKGKVWAA